MTHILNIVQIHFIRQPPKTYLIAYPQSQVINSLQMAVTPNTVALAFGFRHLVCISAMSRLGINLMQSVMDFLRDLSKKKCLDDSVGKHAH